MDNSDQRSTGSVGGGGIAGGIVGGVLLASVVLAGVAFVVHRWQRQKEQAYDKHQEDVDISEQGRKAIANIEMTRNPAGAAVGLVVENPSTPTPPLPSRPEAISFGFNQDLGSEPALQVGRPSSSRRRPPKQKRSLPTPTSPVTPTAHGSPFSVEGRKGQQVAVATQFGTGKLLYVRPSDQCQVVELPWQLADGARAILFRPLAD